MEETKSMKVAPLGLNSTKSHQLKKRGMKEVLDETKQLLQQIAALRIVDSLTKVVTLKLRTRSYRNFVKLQDRLEELLCYLEEYFSLCLEFKQAILDISDQYKKIFINGSVRYLNLVCRMTGIQVAARRQFDFQVWENKLLRAEIGRVQTVECLSLCRVCQKSNEESQQI